MKLVQKQVLRELLRLSVENGFDRLYPLAPIAEKFGVAEVLYDSNTNTGLLWQIGPHGSGLIYAMGDWPNAAASISFDDAHRIENYTHWKTEPVG